MLHRRSTAVIAALTALAGVFASLPEAPSAAADVILAASTSTFRSDDTTTVKVDFPSSAKTGDLLVTSLAYGAKPKSSAIDLVAPSGWSLVTSADQARATGLAVYTHVAAAGEKDATWRVSDRSAVVAMMSAFSGIDTANPVDAVQRVSVNDAKSVTVPSLTSTMPGAALVAMFAQYREKGGLKNWSSPSSMTEIGDQQTGNKKLSASVHVMLRPAAGPTGDITATAAAQADSLFGIAISLRPLAVVTSGPTIRDVTATPGTDGASVAWTTDVAADSQVEFGRDVTYGQSTMLDQTAVRSHVVSLGGLVPDTEYHYRVRSANAAGASTSDDLAFRTLPAVSGGPVSLIVDTDIFSDADDVTALATAFALQSLGEARILAIGINTRTSRPAVSGDSWRCAVAVARFYGSGSVPIGTSLPNNGTDTNTPDFVKPCAALAPSTTPTPELAVNVFRRVLAAQPNGSVVFASTGYFGNLQALLASGPDANSPLTGRALVAQKVTRLVAMGGGYPSWPSENNFRGDIVAAQTVVATWPTAIEFAGYEVGDLIHTGQTISTAHPASSPVRIAYEAFVRPGNWIYSYDLVAVYRAVRPNDPLLLRSGRGRNVVDGNGGNTFTADAAGSHTYLLLGNAATLSQRIEALLDVVPAGSLDRVAPILTSLRVVVGATEATVTWVTDEPATSQVEFGPVVPYATQSSLIELLSTSHSVRIVGLSPGVAYHFRAKSLDGSGNSGASADDTFLTTGVSPGLGGVVVYDDALVGADDWGWAPHDSASTSPVQAGTRAVAVRADPWTGLQIHLRTPFTVAAGSVFEFWVNGEAGGQQITLELFDSGRKLRVPLGALPVNSWRKVQVDLREFAPGESISTIIFYAGTPAPGGRFSLDSIRFTS